jgi:BioY family protein
VAPASTPALPARQLVLADLVPDVRVRNVGVMALGVLFTVLLAQVSVPVPGSPVPITGQTLAVVLTAAALGPVRGVAVQIVYMLAALVGLPFYSEVSGGVDVVFGATGSYVVGLSRPLPDRARRPARGRPQSNEGDPAVHRRPGCHLRRGRAVAGRQRRDVGEPGARRRFLPVHPRRHREGRHRRGRTDTARHLTRLRDWPSSAPTMTASMVALVCSLATNTASCSHCSPSTSPTATA